MTKEKILDAAEKLFVEKGFDGTSVRELALAAGVNLAMINYYFGGKEKLLESLVERKIYFTRMKLEEFSNSQELTVVEKLDRLIDFYVDKVYSNSKFHQMMHHELNLKLRRNLHDRMLDLISQNWEQIRKIVVEGQQHNIYKKDIDIELVIMTIFGLINQCNQSEVFKRINQEYETGNKSKVKNRIKNYLKSLLHDHLIAK